ncbi:MAG: hypothetical protein FJ109_07590 [Deltaproteobacteria bacterium]|nr:hypothetical protein [Deltaproteobacteria bacterium]
MKRWQVLCLFSGWFFFFFLAFCNPLSVPSGDLDEARGRGDSAGPIPDALAADGTPAPPEPAGSGTLRVVDNDGKLVGVLVSRSHRLLEDSELYDAVTVFHPPTGLFFTIRMADASVLLPAKVLFSAGNCTGKAAIRASCADCVSGYDMGFFYNKQWYRVQGGVLRDQFSYSSYVPEEPGAICAGHGNSNTYAFPVDPLGPGETPGLFVPPLRFAW